MRTTISFLLSIQLLPACSPVEDDPSRDPPGQPADDDGADAPADSGTTADPELDDDGGAEGSSDESSSDGGDVDEVPCDGMCVATAPPQWQGPAALIRSDGSVPAPSCGTSHPLAITTLFSDLVAAPAECECGCAPAEDVACDNAQATVSDGLGCVDASATFDIDAGCTNAPAGTGYWSVEFLPQGGECAPIGGMSVPEIDYARWTLCGANELEGACAESETCTPMPLAPFEPGMCIWIDGDVPCPTERFTERQLAHGEIVDTRGCSECTCGAPEGTCEGGVVQMDLSANCPGGLSWEAEHGECLAGESYFESARVTQSATPIVSCAPSPVASVGSATLLGPVTVCCEPELR